MTTPTLLDAAREYVEALEEVEGHVGAYLWEKHGYAETIAQARAAIAREEERQEIIEGLVEAAREAEVWYVPTYDYTRESGQNPDRARRFRAALARYDAMKEDDRG